MLANRGFRLTKWISNCKAVLASVPVEERHADMKLVDLSHMDLPTERALGVRWNVQKDHLAIHITQLRKPATKRGLLSVVSSVYDPLGFASPYTIRAKMIFQDECRRKTNWDELLSNDSMRAWEEWESDLPNLAQLSIPRCYTSTQDLWTSVVSAQLHHFSDASQKAYGSVSY